MCVCVYIYIYYIQILVFYYLLPIYLGKLNLMLIFFSLEYL